MFKLGKKTDSTTDTPKTSWLGKLSSSFSKTRHSFTSGLMSLFSSHKGVDEDLLEALETQLLLADVGIEATTALLDAFKVKAKEQKLQEASDLMALLQTEMTQLLATSEQSPLNFENNDGPFVLLMTGINGAGKTTTIGKLAKKLQAEGKSVMLAAGDTFRAAAIEQLQAWGERNNIPVISQHTGADSASVIYDALQAAKARNIDVLIADTAGRLHTQSNLMSELEKVKRVIQKLDKSAPHETMLVLDASTGQNALHQAIEFNNTVSLNGITLTKLDGTAKGGILFAIASRLNVPIRYVGVGENIDDLKPFRASEFVSAIFEEEST